MMDKFDIDELQSEYQGPKESLDILHITTHISSENCTPPVEHETVRKALDGAPFTKWCMFLDSPLPPRVTLKFSTPISVSGYGIMSGNDFPERDPSKWRILIKVPQNLPQPKKALNSDGLFEQNDEWYPFETRHELRKFNLSERVWASEMQVYFLRDYEDFDKELSMKTSPDGNRELMQIANFLLYP